MIDKNNSQSPNLFGDQPQSEAVLLSAPKPETSEVEVRRKLGLHSALQELFDRLEEAQVLRLAGMIEERFTLDSEEDYALAETLLGIAKTARHSEFRCAALKIFNEFTSQDLDLVKAQVGFLDDSCLPVRIAVAETLAHEPAKAMVVQRELMEAFNRSFRDIINEASCAYDEDAKFVDSTERLIDAWEAHKEKLGPNPDLGALADFLQLRPETECEMEAGLRRYNQRRAHAEIAHFLGVALGHTGSAAGRCLESALNEIVCANFRWFISESVLEGVLEGLQRVGPLKDIWRRTVPNLLEEICHEMRGKGEYKGLRYSRREQLIMNVLVGICTNQDAGDFRNAAYKLIKDIPKTENARLQSWKMEAFLRLCGDRPQQLVKLISPMVFAASNPKAIKTGVAAKITDLILSLRQLAVPELVGSIKGALLVLTCPHGSLYGCKSPEQAAAACRSYVTASNLLAQLEPESSELVLPAYESLIKLSHFEYRPLRGLSELDPAARINAIKCFGAILPRIGHEHLKNWVVDTLKRLES